MGSLQQTCCTHGNRCEPHLESGLQGLLPRATSLLVGDQARAEGTIGHSASVLSTWGRGNSLQPSWWWAQEPRCSRGWILPQQREPAPCPPPTTDAFMKARVLLLSRWWHWGPLRSRDAASAWSRTAGSKRTGKRQALRICTAGVCPVNSCLTW